MKPPPAVHILLALAVFGALCWDSSVRISQRLPGVRQWQAAPAMFAGRDVWIGPSRVTETGLDSFVIAPRAAKPLRVHGPYGPPLDHYVMLRGVLNADGSIRATQISVDAHHRLERVGVYVVSLILLAFVAFAFARRFIWQNGFRPRGSSKEAKVG